MASASALHDTGSTARWRRIRKHYEGTWRDPKAGLEHFGDYADRWLAHRDLKPRTRAHYASVLARHIDPAFGGTPLAAITPAAVREWHAELGQATGPTMRAHAYALLRSVLHSAVADDLIGSNPCRIRGAGNAKRTSHTEPATLAELALIAERMPDRLQMMVLLAAWCGLRFGELIELRRMDVNPARGVVHVRRGVARIKGAVIVGKPKSDAGTRTVNIPPHLAEPLAEHLAEHVGPEPGALLFPGELGGHLPVASLYQSYYPARAAALRLDLRFHDLRHTGATLAPATGATLAELMRRLGHSTPQAAMRYQHAADDRDKAIAEALSGFHTAQVVQLHPNGEARSAAAQH